MSRSFRAVALPIRAGWMVLAASWLVLALQGCTGSGTTATPVVAFVASDEAGPTATIRAFETFLPPDPGGESTPLTSRPGLSRTIDDATVVDLVAVRGDDPALYLLLRDAGGVERLVRYDLSELDPDDPNSVPDAPEVVVADLDALVVTEELLSADDALCATGMALSPDGGWLALLHDPGAGSCPASSDPPAVIALELGSADADERRTGPPGLGSADEAAVPTFVGSGEELRLVWIRASGVVAWPAETGGSVNALAPIELSSPVPALGRSSTGVAVASGTDVVFVPVTGDDAGPVWTVDDGGAIDTVVDTDALPGAVTLVLGRTGLSLVTDLDGDPDEERIATDDVLDDATAVVGPYGYAFVTTGGSLRAYDALTAASATESLFRPVASVLMGTTNVVAIDWAFSAATDLP